MGEGSRADGCDGEHRSRCVFAKGDSVRSTGNVVY